MAAVQKRSEPQNRRDPVRRSRDGVSPLARIENKRPGFKYIWVNTNDSIFGVDYYLALGAEIVQRSADGPKQVGLGRNPFRKLQGPEESYIMFHGCVLMEMSDELAKDIEQYGPDGTSGQDEWDAIERRITGRALAERLERGIGIGRGGRPVIGFENETTSEPGV